MAKRINYSKQQRKAKQTRTAQPTRPSTERDASQKDNVAISACEPANGDTLTLTALAPLIVRSGRPFDDQAGADPARLPPPSTMAGCLRTALARQQGETFRQRIDAGREEELSKLAIRGPLLLRENGDGATEVLVPKPSDALYGRDGGQLSLLRAAPTAPEPGTGCDLPESLLPVCLSENAPGKAGPGPAWWTLEHLLAFREPGELMLDYTSVKTAGWSPPTDDLRTHVAIDRTRLAAKTGQLFQTRGLDLQPTWTLLRQPDPNDPPPPRTIRLLVRTSQPLHDGLVHLGGERRLAALSPEPPQIWPEQPKGWAEAILAAGGLSLTLITPALFDQGWRPGWLDDHFAGAPPGLPGLRLRLRAAALERWQPQSGWDLARQQPRPARRLVPAGAVYWLSIEDPMPAETFDLWLQSVCDREQDRRDGFGLALPAPWTAPTLSD